MDVGLEFYFFNQLTPTCQEAKTNVVTLSGEDPTYVEWALRCLYSGNRKHSRVPSKPLVLLR